MFFQCTFKTLEYSFYQVLTVTAHQMKQICIQPMYQLVSPFANMIQF